MLLVEDIKELEQKMVSKFVYIKVQTPLTHWWLKVSVLPNIVVGMTLMVNRPILTK